MGGDEAAVAALAEKVDVDVANLNCPGQIVISGKREGIAAAIAGAKEAGVRMGKELPVAGAHHSRLMQSAQEKLGAELAEAEIGEPKIPVVRNFEARAVAGADDIRRTLESQVTGSVRWSESMESLLEAGHEVFVELGPGGVLAGFMNRNRRGTKVIAAGDAEGIAAAVEALG